MLRLKTKFRDSVVGCCLGFRTCAYLGFKSSGSLGLRVYGLRRHNESLREHTKVAVVILPCFFPLTS